MPLVVRLLRLAFLAAPLALASGCGVTHDIEFARGCWAEHREPGGPVIAMLRLLPDGPDGKTYTGLLQTFDGAEMTGVPMRYTLARDGSRLDLAPEPATAVDLNGSGLEPQSFEASDIPPLAVEQAEPGDFVAAFQTRPSLAWTILAGGPERLSIYTVIGDGGMGSTLFHGDRDGCD